MQIAELTVTGRMASQKDKIRGVCQYGEDCYRKNPSHFKEYSHPHLEDIIKTGKHANSEEYPIPASLSLTKEIVQMQLGILEKLFPEMGLDQKKATELPNPSSTARAEKSPPKIEIMDDSDDDKSKTDTPKRRSRSPSPRPSTSSSARKVTTTTDESRLAKKQKLTRNIRDYVPVVLPKGEMAKKLEAAAPYNFFLTVITDSRPTHYEPLSITLQEILDESLGEIETSVQINFMVDIGWLLGHYYFAGCIDAPLLVLHGEETPELRTISQFKPQVTAIKINMSTPFATHHTKMMLFGYKDGSMRVVISTANLYEDDWHNRTQGLWMSPRLPRMADEADTSAGESTTGFRNDLMLYLVEYKIAKLQPWIARIRKTDFSSINVFLVASCPGGFREGIRGHPWGHARLGTLLGKHAVKIDETSPVVAQSSSIGSLGPNIASWIQTDFVNSARKDSAPMGIRRLPQFKMIYPSFGNVKSSHDGMLGGGCLPYGKNTNDKQPWLKTYLHQWKSKARHRSQAMPHIKCYGRWSGEDLFWFVLTSANLSKAAWGAFNKTSKLEPCLRINNYEAGVLFLPRFMTGEDTFPMNKSRNDIPPFPMPYDVPLTPYGPDDKPFLMDYLMH